MVAIGRKKQQGHQEIEKCRGDRHLDARGWIVGGRHRQAHLHIDNGTRHDGDIEENIDHQAQHIAQKQLHQKGQGQAQHRGRHLRSRGRDRVDADRQQQGESPLDQTGDAPPP